MSDNAVKRSIRGAESLLGRVAGWAMLGACFLAAVGFLLLFFAGLPIIMMNGNILCGKEGGCSDAGWVPAFWPDWLFLTGVVGFLLYRVHKWAHTVNGRK